MSLNRWARQNHLKTTLCNCGLEDPRRGLTMHSSKCARIVAMDGLIDMARLNSLNEIHSFGNHRDPNIERRFHISKSDHRLGHWTKDSETGRWLLEGVSKSEVSGRIVPITILKDKGKKHG